MNDRNMVSLRSLISVVSPQGPKLESWFCPLCGEQEPVLLPSGRWMRRACACERDARRAADEQRALVAERAAMKQQCFCWMDPTAPAPLLAESTFENFKQALQPKAYATCQTFAQSPEGNLLLLGDPGSGKTHLLAAVIQALRDHTPPIGSRFLIATEFQAEVQRRRALDSDIQGLIDLAKRTPVLIIDDLDKVPSTESRESVYMDILNYRYNRRLPIAISLNTIEQLEGLVGAAGASRLQEGMKPVFMTGDYRTRKAV